MNTDNTAAFPVNAKLIKFVHYEEYEDLKIKHPDWNLPEVQNTKLAFHWMDTLNGPFCELYGAIVLIDKNGEFDDAYVADPVRCPYGDGYQPAPGLFGYAHRKVDYFGVTKRAHDLLWEDSLWDHYLHLSEEQIAMIKTGSLRDRDALNKLIQTAVHRIGGYAAGCRYSYHALTPNDAKLKTIELHSKTDIREGLVEKRAARRAELTRRASEAKAASAVKEITTTLSTMISA